MAGGRKGNPEQRKGTNPLMPGLRHWGQSRNPENDRGKKKKEQNLSKKNGVMVGWERKLLQQGQRLYPQVTRYLPSLGRNDLILATST